MSWIEKRPLKAGGEAWRVVWRDDRDRKHGATFDTRKGAERWRALLDTAGPAAALEALNGPAKAPAAPTVDELLERHIAHLTGIEVGTRRRYTSLTRLHISPHLGHIAITDLTRDDVARWVNVLDDSGLSPKSIKNVHSVLSHALAGLLRDGDLPTNVAKGVRLPRADREEATFLTQEEFMRLVEITPGRWQPLVLLLGATGMRWSEATALQVRHIDLQARTIRIDQAWKYTSGAGHKIGPPKSKRSRRTIALPRPCMEDLERLTVGKLSEVFVFQNTSGGPVRHQTFHGDVWQPAVRQLAAETGKRPRIHDLRHSFASWAITSGLSLTSIQRHMGHESIKTTSDTYGHLFRADRDAFADMMAVQAPAPPAEISSY